MNRLIAVLTLLVLVTSACAALPLRLHRSSSHLGPGCACCPAYCYPQPTQGLPELRPPVSGGLLNPPTPTPTEPGTRQTRRT